VKRAVVPCVGFKFHVSFCLVFHKSFPTSNVCSNEKTSINFLDRQSVMCPAGQVLTRFQLQRSDRKVRYNYSCLEASIDTCEDRQTDFSDMGAGGIFFLDRQYIKVNEGEVLAGFQLNSNYNPRSIRYNYRACKLYTQHVNGTIKDEQGQDITGNELTVTFQNDRYGTIGAEVNDGAYKINLPAGYYTRTVAKSGYSNLVTTEHIARDVNAITLTKA